ncbi:hypothetical protein NDU88_001456 [Pleurodeles waltl]|uniref:Uncharacterized protein n=1 Tax=Pleurodeles waltl TaxID=8319 RepID=A0AAV7WNN0_PLEWA|nr:hypothetical protein NDU88_001456 [Pleurodeles waltl]
MTVRPLTGSVSDDFVDGYFICKDGHSKYKPYCFVDCSSDDDHHLIVDSSDGHPIDNRSVYSHSFIHSIDGSVKITINSHKEDLIVDSAVNQPVDKNKIRQPSSLNN